MDNKLLITRIAAFGLSSGIVIPLLIIGISYQYIIFIITIYLTIGYMTYRYNNKRIQFIYLLKEGILTTIISYNIGILIAFISSIGLPNLFIMSLYGTFYSLFIGAFLGVINYIILNAHRWLNINK